MPPRRSSRSRASVESTPVDPVPLKRKRGQDVNNELEEKENLEKPPSRSRRSSSDRLSGAASTRSRASTRREPVEPTVEEEKVLETDVEAPPSKKKRPSLEPEDDEQEDDEEEEEEKPKAKVKSRRATKPAQQGQPSRSNRSNRSQKPVLISDDEEDPDVAMAQDEGSEFEEARAAPQSKSKKPAKRGHPSRTKPAPKPKDSDVDGQSSEVEEYVMPKRRDPGPRTPLKSQPARREATVEEEEVPKAASNLEEEEEEEEEEKSLLFDHPPTLPPPSQSQAKVIPEEPKGPQSRLVIHKLALTNFKSYAGRQEIGPFHKVYVIRLLSIPALTPPPVVFFHRRRQRIWQIQHHRCPPFRVWLSRGKNAPGQSL